MENHGGMMSTGKLIRPPELSRNPTSSHRAAKQNKMIFVHTSKVFLMFSKILRHGADGFTSPPKQDAADFYRP
jgi:hypothetical protein